MRFKQTEARTIKKAKKQIQKEKTQPKKYKIAHPRIENKEAKHIQNTLQENKKMPLKKGDKVMVYETPHTTLFPEEKQYL